MKRDDKKKRTCEIKGGCAEGEYVETNLASLRHLDDAARALKLLCELVLLCGKSVQLLLGCRHFLVLAERFRVGLCLCVRCGVPKKEMKGWNERNEREGNAKKHERKKKFTHSANKTNKGKMNGR